MHRFKQQDKLKDKMKKIVMGTAMCAALVSISMASFTGCKAELKNELITVELKEVTTPQEAIERLKEGNTRYVADSCAFPHHNHQRVEETAPHQAPFVAIVGCSDSRVPVEMVFDQGIGDIFVIRTAGNSVNDNSVMGSIDYAITHLGVKAVVVLGHESCGGVTGAIAVAKEGEVSHEEGKVSLLLEVIREDVKEYIGMPDSLSAAIALNTNKQVERIKQCEHVQKLVNEGKLSVVAAHYNVHTGKVEF